MLPQGGGGISPDGSPSPPRFGSAATMGIASTTGAVAGELPPVPRMTDGAYPGGVGGGVDGAGFDDEVDIDDLTDAMGEMQVFAVDMDTTNGGMSPGLPVLIRPEDLQKSFESSNSAAPGSGAPGGGGWNM